MIEQKSNLPKRIGARLKDLRKSFGITLKHLAAQMRVSVPLLSRIENGLVTPSLSTLEIIANTLGVDIGYFFKDGEEKELVVSRRGSRQNSFVRRGPKRRIAYAIEPLAEGSKTSFMEPCIVSLFGTKEDEVYTTTHEGQEFLYVLEGRLELTLGENKIIMGPGDAAYFNGQSKHKGIRLGKKPARTLNVHLIPGKRMGTFESL